QNTLRTVRYPRHATMPVIAISTVSTKTRNRCENSMTEWIVPDGHSDVGVQLGHVSHPSPEPEPRTSPPTANSSTVVPAVARQSFWNRVMFTTKRRPRSAETEV